MKINGSAVACERIKAFTETVNNLIAFKLKSLKAGIIIIGIGKRQIVNISRAEILLFLTVKLFAVNKFC